MLEEIIWIISFIALINIFKFIGLNILNLLNIKLRDKGNAISTIIGISLISYIVWFCVIVLHAPFNFAFCWIILGLSFLASAFNSLKQDIHIKSLSLIRTITTTELIFYLFFGIALYIRSRIPSINVIEDFMNFGIMNGLGRSEYLPPMDVWYSGNTINYYYFGHFIFAFIQKLTQIPSAALYNIYFAFIVASAASMSAFIGIYLTGKIKAGLFTPFILIFAGNMNYFTYIIINRSFDNYYYGNARNLVQNVITEFPAYSFILGNLHAHIINIPYVLAVIVMCIYIYKEKTNYLSIALSGIFLGILGITNSWDLIVYLPLTAYLVILNQSSNLKMKISYLVIILFLVVITISPFLISFKSPVSGISFVRDWLPYDSILTMFGMYFLVFVLFIFNFKNSFNNRLLLILFGYSCILIILPQIIYFKDIYDSANPPFYKANTVFKFWYQACILLSVITIPLFISGVTKYRTFIFKYFVNIPLVVIILLSIVFSIAYSAVAYKYKIKNSEEQFTLLGDAYLIEADSRKPMIDWLNPKVKGQPVILENPGEAYTSDSLVSSYTGLPTPVGWINHEFGWRNNWPEIALRLGDVEILYNSNNPEEIWPLIDKYQIQYIVISHKEKDQYGNHAGQGLRFISEPVIKVGDDELLKITEFTL